MIEHFFKDDDEYKDCSLQERFILDIIACEANMKFYRRTIDILVERNPDFNSRDENTKCRISGMKADYDTSFEVWHRLKRLYESEYGELSDFSMNAIEHIAEAYAESALKGYGWIKENISQA